MIIQRKIYGKTCNIDGLLGWSMNADQAGFKSVFCSTKFSDAISGTASVKKYNGSTLTLNAGLSAADCHNGINASKDLYLSMADSDTGWTETLNPNTNAIKAYFNGWKANANNGTVYTSWQSVVDATAPGTNTEAYVANNRAPNYTPYSMVYKLTVPLRR